MTNYIECKNEKKTDHNRYHLIKRDMSRINRSSVFVEADKMRKIEFPRHNREQRFSPSYQLVIKRPFVYVQLDRSKLERAACETVAWFFD